MNGQKARALRRIALDLCEIAGLVGGEPVGPGQMARLWGTACDDNLMRRWERWKAALGNFGAPVIRVEVDRLPGGQGGLVLIALEPIAQVWAERILDAHESPDCRAARVADEARGGAA